MKKRIKKRYLILGIFILLVAIALFFFPTIIKNQVVKNSEKLIGRKVEIGDLKLNYLKMAVRASEVAMYEENKTDTFIFFRELYADFSPWKLIDKEYSFSTVGIDRLQANIIQSATGFNFDSLAPEVDSSSATGTDTTASGVRFSIYNISLTNSDIRYVDKPIDSQIEIKDLNLELPQIAWNREQSDIGAKFNIGGQGVIEVDALVDNSQGTYQVGLKTTDVSLKPVAVYLKGYADIGGLDGLLTSELEINGGMGDYMDMAISGKGKISNLVVKDGGAEDIFEAVEIKADIDELNLGTSNYAFSRIELEQPQLRVTRDTETTNIERFLLPYFEGTANNTEITGSAGNTALPEETQLTYNIDTMRVKRGKVWFIDKSLSREFVSLISDLDLNMSGLTESASHIPLDFSAELNRTAKLEGKTVLNMQQPMYLEFEGHLKQLDLINFSPYSEYYISSPVTQGWLNYALKIKMTPEWLDSQNKIKIEELEFGKKTKEKPQFKVPIRLALYIMKDVNDNITIDMPVSGSTSDPKFKLGKLIWKTFANLMVKTAASPFKALAGLAGTNPEKLEYMGFSFTQDSLDAKQMTTLKSLSRILKKKPDMAVILNQRTDEEKEKSELAVKLVKEKYVNANSMKLSPENSDTSFLGFIRQQVPALDSLGFEKACLQFIPPNEINGRFRELLILRNQLVHDFLVGQGLSEESVNVSISNLKTLPKELRKPEYKVEVSLQ